LFHYARPAFSRVPRLHRRRPKQKFQYWTYIIWKKKNDNFHIFFFLYFFFIVVTPSLSNCPVSVSNEKHYWIYDGGQKKIRTERQKIKEKQLGKKSYINGFRYDEVTKGNQCVCNDLVVSTT
jgi:hypothetical protein